MEALLSISPSLPIASALDNSTYSLVLADVFLERLAPVVNLWPDSRDNPLHSLPLLLLIFILIIITATIHLIFNVLGTVLNTLYA